jgi:hypothetical protein
LQVIEKEDRVFEVPEVTHPLAANLENKILLAGYNVSPEPMAFTQSTCAAEECWLHFDFYWQGLSEMETLYSGFLHVIDEQGNLITQRDWIPGKGKQPTTSWLPTEVIADPLDLTLPAGIAPGRYRVIVGMYHPPNGSRLLVVDDGQTVSDFILLGEIRVTR